MVAISDAQLASMRAQVSASFFLPDTCVLWTNTETYEGGFPVAGSAVAGTVACRLDPVQNREMVAINEALGRETLTEQYRLTTPYDSPLAEDMTVVVGSREYQVVQLDDVHSWNVSKRALVVEVR